ncbi:hypothetical protein GCM10009678_64410 [Actinomadura kijaniata]
MRSVSWATRAGSGSPRCSRLFTPDPDEHKARAEPFQAESAKRGRDHRPGEHTGIVLLSDQQGVPPPDQVKRNLEIFAGKVMPEFA